MCDDYRAAYHIDQHHEAADGNSPIKVPFAAVWGRDGVMAKTFDMDSVWKTKGTLFRDRNARGIFLLINTLGDC